MNGDRNATRCGFAGLAALAAAALSTPYAADAQTLREALALAYSSNPTLEAARNSLRAVDETFVQARALGRPTVSLGGSASASESETTQDIAGVGTTTTDGTFGAADVELTASQSLYRGGRTRAAKSSARAGIESQRAVLVGIEQDVLLSALIAYVDTVRDQEVINIRLNNVEVLNQQLQASRDRFEVGQITRTDVAQAEARLAGAQAELAAARAEFAASAAAFENVIGQPPAALEESSPVPAVPEEIDDVIAQALSDNPDVVAARFAEESARFDVREAQGRFRPSLSVEGSASYSEPLFDSTREDTSVSAVARLDVPILTGGLNGSLTRAARAVQAQRRDEVRSAERAARESAITAWSAFASARSQVASSAEQVRANEVAFDGVEEEARVGLRTTLDVLDAEQELLDARLALVFAERDAFVSAHQVLEAVGALTASGLGLDAPLYDPEDNFLTLR